MSLLDESYRHKQAETAKERKELADKVFHISDPMFRLMHLRGSRFYLMKTRATILQSRVVDFLDVYLIEHCGFGVLPWGEQTALGRVQ